MLIGYKIFFNPRKQKYRVEFYYSHNGWFFKNQRSTSDLCTTTGRIFWFDSTQDAQIAAEKSHQPERLVVDTTGGL